MIIKLILSQLIRTQTASVVGTYLGVPLEVPRSKSQACNDIQESINRCLAGWKARSLSQAGRTVLLQSVAMALPSYYMYVFLLPKQVCRRLDTNIKNFWWGFDGTVRRLHPKSWASICKSKLCVGLGLRRMEDLNRAFVAKLG